MAQWKKTRYSLMGPLMIWVAFIIFVPSLIAAMVVSAEILPPIGDTVVKTACMFSVLVFAPLAALAEIAPPFVTRAEINWRNGNSGRLFDGDVIWEAVPFLPPFLNRIRRTASGRKRQEEEKRAPATNGNPSTS